MITDVPGVRVGHATDPVGLTGVTVVLCDRAATCGVELRGGANDVVGLDYLGPRHLVATVNGVVLGGGSRFGEEAIYGVMRWVEERGVGFATGPTVVPHVPGAFLFDLSVGDGRARPTREMGYEAAARAVASPVAEGSVGAGAGSRVGKVYGIARAMGGGIGSVSVRLGEVIVGGLVAVNAVGDVRDPDPGALVAGTRDAAEGRRLVDSARALRAGAALGRFAAPEHTTIGVIATNARLDRAEAAALAALGMLGFDRALSPPHTPFDGDTLFALSVGDRPADLTRLGLAAADAVARAICRGARAAHPGAGVDARDEREVAVRRAPDVETVRVRELRRVTVGGADPERDERSRVHRDATEHRVAHGAPVAELVRALEPEELLDGARDQAGLGAQPQVLPRVLEQAHNGVGDQVRRGLVARVEEEDALVQELQLGEAVAGVLGREQRGQDLAGIRARAPPPVGDQPAEVALELVNGAAARLEAPGAGLRLERAENRERPAAQRPALLPRHAEHVADELDGQRGGEVLHDVHPTPGGGAVEEPVHEPDDTRLERGKRPRSERRGEQLPDARVVGRIAEDDARRVMLVERARAELRRELHTLVGVPREVVLVDGGDVIVAREEVRAIRAAVHRVPAPQPVVVGERVVVEVVGQRAQIEGERRRALRLLREDTGRRHSGAGSWGRSSSRASAYRSASARTSASRSGRCVKRGSVV